MADIWDEYVWIVALGCFVAFFMAYGIGANDVANAFATSVGSKTLTLFQACVLAAIFEFAGAVLLGRGVTDTIRKGIVDRDVFEDQPEILMYGMFCALTAAGTWLLVATYFELPVSTTHSIIGGIVGMALVAYGKEAVVWHDIDEDEKFPVVGISSVVISWFFSPIASGIVAAFFFLGARTAILRSERSYERTFYFLPLLVFICIFINAFYVLDKGINKQWEWIKDHTERSAWIAAVIAAVSFVATIFISIWLKKQLDADHSNKQAAAEDAEKNGGVVEKGVLRSSATVVLYTENDEEEAPTSFFGRLSAAINSNDPHSALDEDVATREMHDNAEVFDERTEGVFRYLQVLTSCADAFAHGANDVANSIGPFSAIWHVYRKQELSSKSDVPIWILIIGGIGIVLGLATYGYTIIKAIGVKLTKITPSRGFSIELGSALVVVTGSYLGLPLSTTHCQVGATAFVGLLEGGRGISWSVLSKAIFGWVFTLIVVGFVSALLMALGIFTPNIRSLQGVTEIKNALNSTTFDEVVEWRANPLCESSAQQAQIEDIAGMWQGVTERNFRHPLRIATAIEYMSEAREIINAPEDASCQLPELPSFAEEENYDFECPEDYERAATGELACVPVEEEEE